MSVDKAGKWWVGDQPKDIREFLEAYAADGYKVDGFRASGCACGSEQFLLWADDDEGCAKRQCESCKRSDFICDSEDYWEGAKPQKWKCIECKSNFIGDPVSSPMEGQLVVNGVPQSYLAKFVVTSLGDPPFNGGTVTQSWIYSNTGSNVAKLQARMALRGTPSADVMTHIIAIWIKP